MGALVIEDDAVTGAALVEMLRQNGWRAEWACDLLNAEAKMATFDPDLLVVDLHMRNSDVPAWLAAWGKGRRLVFLTAAARPETDEVRKAFPDADMIHKPASRKEIIRVLGRGHKGVTS